MEIDESVFSKKNPEMLLFIIKQSIEKVFDFKNPYSYFIKNYQILEKICKLVGIDSLSYRDVEFISKFMTDNSELIQKIFETKDKSLLSELEYPINKMFKIPYEIYSNQSIVEIYTVNWDSYDKNFVRSSLIETRNDGNFDEWTGDLQRTDVLDSEVSEWIINDDEITEINTEKTESILDRLVIENTSSVINSLDRNTLINLRNIINSRLSSL
jgi:hypothetical protein